jgi:hypothetical protein
MRGAAGDVAVTVPEEAPRPRGTDMVGIDDISG